MQLPLKMSRQTTDPWAHSRAARIRVFMLVVTVLGLPFLLSGVALLDRAPHVLAIMLVFYAYLPVYYLLNRAGRGELGTIICLGILAVITALDVYFSVSGVGFLVVGNALFISLIIAAAAVLASARAVDTVFAFGLLAYLAILFVELLLDPTTTVSGQPLPPTAVIYAVAANFLVALIGGWVVLRYLMYVLRRLTNETEQARIRAEERAAETAALAEQLTSSNEALMLVQARLSETVDALTLPLIPLADGVLLLPVVGYLDGARGERLREQLLSGVHERQARTLILDVTGLRAVDHDVAALLLTLVRGARLLGARVIVSGVSAQMAQALVGLEVSRSELETVAGLSEALELAAAPQVERK